MIELLNWFSETWWRIIFFWILFGGVTEFIYHTVAVITGRKEK